MCPAQLGKDLLILREDHLVNFGGLLGAGDFFIPPVPFAGDAPNQLFAFQPLQKLGHRRMGHMLDALQIVLVDFRFPGSLQTADEMCIRDRDWTISHWTWISFPTARSRR